MNKITEEKKLQLLKNSAIASVIFFLVLFICISIFQISWNIYRYRFAQDGMAVIVDNQLVVGVERIIRGDEAYQILKKNSTYDPTPEPGKELILLKIKVKNITWWKAYPRYLEFIVNIKGSNKYRDHIDVFYNEFSTTGEFKILDTSKTFKPGEVRDGTFGFEINKGQTLSNINIERSSLRNTSLFRGNKDYKIPLSKSPLMKIDYFLIYILMVYLFFVWVFLKTYRQREERTNGFIQEYFNTYLVLLFTITFFNHIYPFKFIIGFYLFFIIGTMIDFINNRRKYLIKYCWVSKKDIDWMIAEFVKRMQWENSLKKDLFSPEKSFFYDTVRKIEIQNPINNETYIFMENTIQVKNPTQDNLRAREILLDIIREIKIDWYSLFKQLFGAHLLFFLYLLLIVFFFPLFMY